ncbi:alginate export family protein [Spongiibacter marinus]|uniref:alginate export family protein n=1 Tax=Spongiibacter marinus TaxID=354246 RepID=UPI0035BE9CDD
MRVIANAVLLGAVAATLPATSFADSLADALANGKVYGDFRLRYEAVSQDNALDDASALTLRSRLGYQTAAYQGFSAQLEFEDSRIVAGEGEFSAPPAGYKTGQYSVIADPETTELDQAFLRYQHGGLTAKLGRQVIIYDGHRFVGHVGWRQDRQTFDGVSLNYQANDVLSLSYAYLGQRNGIFAEQADKQAKDHLLNLRFNSAVGTVTAYSYLLELNEAGEDRLDTSGVSVKGAKPLAEAKLLYHAEIARQRADTPLLDADAEYMLLEAGVAAAGLTAKVGYEVLGSDDGSYGFATPLATLHKFNGWADIFLKTPAGGLVDRYASLGGSLAGGKWALIYHDYRADDDAAGADAYGSEVNAVYSRKFAKHYSVGVKYAAYSADELAVDTDKLWFWVGAAF